jgi:ADP-ribose pyrophosphatase
MFEPKVAWEGQFIRAMAREGWEYATRKGASGVVGIVAVTDEGRIILVDQMRMPLGRRVIELPAGLVGDHPAHEAEALETAARRELLEETGYEAAEMLILTEGASSAGMTDETVTLLLARGLRKIGPGGGDASEDITVHEIPLEGLVEWIAGQQAGGKSLDFKIYAGLYLRDRMQG